MIGEIKPKKCKVCRELFTPKRSSLEQVCSFSCSIELGKSKPVKPNYAKIKKEKLDALDTKKQTYVKRVNKIKLLFQAWVRNRDKYEPCASCGAITATEWHGGHLYKAENYSGLIFDERNCHKQCKKCNVFLDGNELAYRDRLKQRFGEQFMEKLRLDAYLTKVKTWSDEELEEIKINYGK